MAGAAVRVTPHMKKQAKARLVLQEKEQKRLAKKRVQGTGRKAKTKKRSSFKLRLFLLFVITVILCQAGIYAYSQNQALCMEVLKFPGRIVTTLASACFGAVTEGFNGIVHTEQQYASETFAHADEDPLMIPVGIVGAAIAIPVGFVTGAPEGVMQYGQRGYEWWDSFGQA